MANSDPTWQSTRFAFTSPHLCYVRTGEHWNPNQNSSETGSLKAPKRETESPPTFFVCLFFYTAGSYYSSILYTSVYTCQSQSPNSAQHHPHPTAVFPPWCPYVCSLHLCLNFCPANRFICTIFLGSTYMR